MPAPGNPSGKPPNHKGTPFVARLVDGNGSPNLLIDGTTPVEYLFTPLAKKVVVTELVLMFEVDHDVSYGSDFMGLSALANGIVIDIEKRGQVVSANMQTNRDMLEYSSLGGFFLEKAGSYWVAKAIREFSRGLKLSEHASSPDLIRLTVQDNLTRLSYGAATVFGYVD